MPGKIRLALAGVGNCASALLQGLAWYAQTDSDVGLTQRVLGGYDVCDITPVLAFDVSALKVGRDLAEAIMAPPNCAWRVPEVCVAKTGVEVLSGPVGDGMPPHLAKYAPLTDAPAVDVAQALRASGAEVLLNMLPTGSAQAARRYAQAALEAGVAFINGMPELIVCDEAYQRQALARGVPVVGDDVKSQLGGTILHRAMVEAMQARGIHIRRTYQLNYAGNTDFDNLVNRGESKEQTKREAVETLIPYETGVSTGFAHVPVMGDRKTTRFYFDVVNFSGAPLHIDATLEVEDSANFGGTAVDAIRCCRIALDRGVGGVLESASALYCKHPPLTMTDAEAVQQVTEFVQGSRER